MECPFNNRIFNLQTPLLTKFLRTPLDSGIGNFFLNFGITQLNFLFIYLFYLYIYSDGSANT